VGETQLYLVCVECGEIAAGDAPGWRAYLTADDPPMVSIYCPDCARREFDDDE